MTSRKLGTEDPFVRSCRKLAEEPDVISAFHQLQKLHQEFRAIGPVAKDLREEIWSRFKACLYGCQQTPPAAF